jgi:hypothetical protein
MRSWKCPQLVLFQIEHRIAQVPAPGLRMSANMMMMALFSRVIGAAIKSSEILH